jgi:hypothetical protein
MVWENAWVFRRCSCPAAHYVAGVCPKLTFLAQWRDKTIEEVAALVKKHDSNELPKCTGDDSTESLRDVYARDASSAQTLLEKGTLCWCALHYRARAVCPRRNDFVVVVDRDRRDGSQCRTDHYGTGTHPYGITSSAASLAWTVLMNASDGAERLFTSECPLVAREARDRMLADARVTWSGTAKVRADEEREQLRVGSPAVLNLYELVYVQRNGNVTTERKLYSVADYLDEDDAYVLYDHAAHDMVHAKAGDVMPAPWIPTIGSIVTAEVPRPQSDKNDKVTGVVLDYA